jgi:hypothetical protein
MKVRIVLYGKVNETLTSTFVSTDVSEIYNYIASKYPNNDWEDLVCTSADYGYNEMTVRIQVI